MGLGAVTIGIAVIGVLTLLAVLVNSSRTRRRRRAEEVPANLAPFLTDDELESRRLDRVLIAALVSAAILAVVVPIYYIGEQDRQAEAAEKREEFDIEEGEHWYEFFGCQGCHGAEGVGGGVTFVEPRSGLETLWAAPSLNDELYRYDADEVRYWITFGRAGTPMPALGLEGGGAMTDQEIDQVIAYLEHIRIPQSEALTQVDSRVNLALSRLDGGDEAAASAVAEQEALVALIESADEVLTEVGDLPQRLDDLLAGPGTCTAESAELVARPCEDPGVDSDRDGLSDAAELMLADLMVPASETLSGFLAANNLEPERLAIALDPADAFTLENARGEPRADLASARSARTALNTVMINLRATAENQQRFLDSATSGLSFLRESAAARRWAVDFDELAETTFDGDVDTARRAVGLYNAYCARCHTGGYSAGVQFELEPGSGGFGPSLVGDRSLLQFPTAQDHIDFIVEGSENAKPYGVNGAGRGWMPGFGFVMSADDIALIVEYERSM